MIFQALDPTGLNETAEQVRAIVQEAKAEIEAELDSLDYAQPDGIYPEMTVGAVIGSDETSQWATRESTGSGAATVRSVQGATVGWNQLIQNGNFASSTGWVGQQSSMSVDNGECTLTSTGQGTFFSLLGTMPRPVLYASHKYLGSFDVKSKTANVRMGLNAGNTGTLVVAACTTANANTWTHVAGIIKLDNVGYYTIFPIISNTPGGPSTETGDWFTVRNIMFFDLTAMFGSGNEPSTVAEFEAMYPASYYPYSAPTLKPVQIAGIASTTAQGGELDAIEWTAQTLRAAGSVADMLYADHVDVRAGVYTFTGSETLKVDNWQPTEDTYAVGFPLAMIDASWPTSTDIISNVRMAELETIPYGSMYIGAKVGLCLAPKPQASAYSLFVRVPKTLAADKNTLMAWLAGKTIFYELATPTTTPISPALPMTYKVQAGGSEAIIVPSGEISATPIITIAEPVNMSTELAQIWAAIEALQGSRGSALGSVRSDSDVSSTEVKEAPTMDEKQTTERESEA